jgi:hypothetical protein
MSGVCHEIGMQDTGDGEGTFTVVEDDGKKLAGVCDALAASPGQAVVESELKVGASFGSSQEYSST